jgi:collagenase-like PrtC family protease
MNPIRLSVGYSAGAGDLQRLLEASDCIFSVYTGGLAGKIAGGRPQYLTELDTLKKNIAMAHERGVRFEIALNAPCGLESKSNTGWWQEIRDYLRQLEECGVDYIIASHPFLMSLVKEHTKMKVVASTICEITTVRSALYYEEIGADVIIPSMNVNYDLQVLHGMRSKLKNAGLRIMVNEHCLGDCPWRRFHHSHYAHSNEERDYHMQCKTMFLKKPYLLLTNNFIRPEDIRNYLDITHDFKIVGRLVPVDDLVSRIKAYSEGTYEGNSVELVDSGLAKIFNIPNNKLDGLFEHKKRCDRICNECGYCIDLYDGILKKA